MIYKVTKQYGQGLEGPADAFKTLEEAKAFVQSAAAQDAAMKIKVVYKVYEFDDLLHEVDSSHLVLSVSNQQSEDDSGQGQQSGAHSRPNPLGTTLQPKGALPRRDHPTDAKDDKDQGEK